ncbi:hypothetical protein [Ethanoligenens harbinense]|uniref:hypothetical protein n=1 Tax=Ethanoligenens harbinense TaxID=253239 RepID=UPI0013C4C98A|nr:hypothetical protein [Ethanoligenens harbinense]
MRLGKISRLWHIQIVALPLLLLISCLVEIFLFNFRYYEPLLHHAPKREIQASAFSEVTDGTKPAENLQIQNGEGSVTLTQDAGIPVYCITLNAQASAPFQVKLIYSDDDKVTPISGGTWTVDPAVAGSNTFRMVPSGRAHQIHLQISNATGTVTLVGATLNQPFFHFNKLRFILLSAVLILLYLVWRYRLRAQPLDTTRTWQKLAFGSLLAISIVFVFCISGITAIVSPFTDAPITLSAGPNVFGPGVNVIDLEQLMTQALAHGHIDLLIKPADALQYLTNAYSADQRQAQQIPALLDASYFHGKYYSYFGLSPQLIMLPFRLITGKYIGTDVVWFIFDIFLQIATLRFYLSVVKRWFSGIGFLPCFIGAATIFFGSGVLVLAVGINFYGLTQVSALCFLFWGFSMLFDAYCGKSATALRLTLSGLFFGMVILSRPNIVVFMLASVFLLAPIFQRTSKTRRVKWALCFCIPFAAIMLFQLFYNLVRFGSPLQFGNNYQLTSYDIQYNQISNVARFFAVLWHYLFQQISWDLTFPFVHINRVDLNVSSGFYYNSGMAGLINYPVYYILLFGATLRSRMRKTVKGHFLAALLLLSGLLICFDALKAGVDNRYLTDLMPVLLFASLLLWFELLHRAPGNQTNRWGEKLFYLSCSVTIALQVLCNFPTNISPAFYNTRVTFFHFLSQTFMFWR